MSVDGGTAPSTRGTTPAKANPYLITFMCAFAAMLDGFDLQAAAYTASGIVATWHIKPTFLGMILSASLLGVFVGAIVLSPLADRFGRKRMILVSALLFGAFSCGAALAPTPEAFLAFRMLTGVGLGAAMPSLIGYVAEAAPQATRARFITAMFVGLPFGSFVGGLVAGPLTDGFGWRSIFWIGGIAPLILLPALVWIRPNDERRPPIAEPRSHQFTEVRALFNDGRARMTLLLWLAFFVNLLMMHVLSAWLPTLLKTSGQTPREALIAASLYHFGGILGGIALGQTIDRTNPIRLMVLIYAIGCAMVAAAAFTAGTFAVFLPFAIAVGACNIGGQVVLNTVAALSYPNAIRSTGVGWALGVGRWGSILGPTAVGALVAAGWTTQAIVLSVTVPMAIAALSMVFQPRFAAHA